MKLHSKSKKGNFQPIIYSMKLGFESERDIRYFLEAKPERIHLHQIMFTRNSQQHCASEISIIKIDDTNKFTNRSENISVQSTK